MALTPGTRLGVYEVTTQIGAGGMGEVYRATDSNLKRSVAIKVLPASLAGDADRLARFQREAEMLAALNHPNIAAIYGLEKTPDFTALVMELVEGDDLSLQIARDAIPIGEALRIAGQIAEALEAAHAKGIVHRDLKPANIKITPQGAVKVLDFGLAKALGDVSEADPLSASHSPTVVGATAAGVILGTAAYMSPEQARGRPVDAQTDIWAFGCVLFEMLSGRRAFQGDTVTDTLAAIVREHPTWEAIPSDTPQAARSLLDHCLNKDPSRRLRHIGDARLAIDDARTAPALTQPVTSTRAATSARLMSGLPWAIAVAALAATVLAVAAGRQRAVSEKLVTWLELSLPANEEIYTVSGAPLSISPDGTLVALAAAPSSATSIRATYIRRLDEPDTKRLPGTEFAASLFFSPDNSRLGFTASDGTLRSVSLKDGMAATLFQGVDYNSGGAFKPDGHVLFVRDRTFWEVAPSRGEIKQLSKLDAGRHELTQQWPAPLPGGRAILFTSLASSDADGPRIEALTLADGARRVVIERASFPMYLSTGHLVFLRGASLMAAPFDAARLETTGPAVRVVEAVAVTGSGAPIVAMSDTGTLVYAPADATARRLVWVTRQGLETPISDVARSYAAARLSPDGRRIAVPTETSGLWLQDTTRQVFTRLTAPEPNTHYPVWTPDGQRVYYRSITGIRWIQADGSGRGGTIPDTSQQDAPGSISPDGRTLAYLRTSSGTGGDIYLLSLDGDAKPRPFVRTPAYEGGPQFSPDGRWMAYASNDSGQFQIYVRPFPGPDRRTQVSTDGGSYPLWSRNGKELFYRNGNKMMAVQIATGALDADPVLSPPKLLFDRSYAFIGTTMAPYDISADGQRFVMAKPEIGANRLNVVINWSEELKRRVPVRP